MKINAKIVGYICVVAVAITTIVCLKDGLLAFAICFGGLYLISNNESKS